MNSRVTVLFLLAMMFSCSAFSQITKYNYQFSRAFPDTNYKMPVGAQGVAVDPEGKVWIAPYNGNDSINVSGTFKRITPIHVFNANGTPASFSPIRFVTVSGITDTLFFANDNNRGIATDKNGNIVFTRTTGTVYRVNYKTGAGMTKVIPQAASPTAPAFDGLNKMFIGLVNPNTGPIRIYNQNFSFLANVVDTSQGLSRTLGVSPDGNDVFWCGYSNLYVTKYHSANGSLGPYNQSVQIMNGLDVEAIARHPSTGYWWVGSGDPTDGSNLPPYSNYTFYAFASPNYSTPVDSFQWQGVTPVDDPRPRGIAFSPTGDTVYVCEFNVSNKPCVQMFIKSAPSVPVQNKSAFFDGNARIRVTDASPINPGAVPSAYQISGTAITMEAWIFPLDVPSGTDSRYIIARPANTGFGVAPYQTFGLFIYGDVYGLHQPRIGVAISDGTHPIGAGFEFFVEDTAAVKIGQWTHIAGTYDGTNVKLYINGVMVHQVAFNVSMGTGSTGLYIGGSASGYFKGLIDDVRLWNIARTQSSIQSTMSSVLTGNESGLKGYWPMDSVYTAAGGVLATIDKTSNHNDLAVQFNAKLIPFPEGSTVQIAPVSLSLSNNYAITGELYSAKLSPVAWPIATVSVAQKPSGMIASGDSLFWTPSDNQYGNFPVIATSTNIAGTRIDTFSVFSEAVRAAQNQVQTDVTHRGKLGALGNYGKGMVYKGKNGLFAGDFSLVNRSNAKYAGGLYSGSNGQQSFKPAEGFATVPSRFAGFTAFKTSFTDEWEANRIGVRVFQTVHSSTTPGDDKYAIIEYRVVNESGTPIGDLFSQLSTDFDIGAAGNNLGGYDSLLQMSYAYEVGGANNTYSYGFSLLNKPVSGEVVFGIGTDSQYVRSTTKLTVKVPNPTVPADYRNQISTGPFSIAQGETLTVAFAVFAGDNLNDISISATRAKHTYYSGLPSVVLNTPRILRIKDVPNDNGKQITVLWKYSPSPAQQGVEKFAIWRRDSVKTFVLELPALNDTVYSVVVPTLFDSTKSKGMFYSVFQVSAHAVDPANYAMSTPDSGYSLDNLAPKVPDSVSATSAGGFVVLKWKENAENDLQYYTVYRSESPTDTSQQLVGYAFTTKAEFRDSSALVGKKYYYRVSATDFSGNRSAYSKEVSVTATSVGDVSNLIPANFALEQNFPNPFNPSTTIRYGLPIRSSARIVITNMLGQQVAVLENGEREPGYHEVQWLANVASGIYFYRIDAVSVADPNNRFVQVKKMLLLK